MAEIVNLRQARKARDRAGGKAEAEVNRRAHGRSKVEKDATAREKAALDRTLDGAHLEKPEES